ncbi:hypothetical protein N0B31_03055 [Salinirubellus salinus]|uniref:Uncharacterized protein n=1 Tax=Salinirubellus salinus TaxID=1364945 RepID=A0A9E7R4X4_9EURY|nr:hypothetical protein [Salinirubellus salinus]UWM55269.1 hypothetical protein N0B31_03055 [Salinirubellus salinus]
MNVTKLSAALLAVLVVTTGVGAVAATPGNGNVPDDAGSNAADAPTDDGDVDANTTDARDDGMSRDEVEARAVDESDAADDSEAMADPRDASDAETPRSEAAPVGAADAQERRGPPADLPEQVPAHVSEINQRIVSFLDGELDDFGTAVSDVTPDDGADAEATSTDEPETEEPETDEDGDSTETATATPTTEV